jgi:hypothetical protein
MHKAKIDMADEIFVINVGGYIGDSTRSEIEYAIMTGKAVEYLEPAGTESEIDPETRYRGDRCMQKSEEQRKMAVITGGAKGIGKCIAGEFRKPDDLP